MYVGGPHGLPKRICCLGTKKKRLQQNLFIGQDWQVIWYLRQNLKCFHHKGIQVRRACCWQEGLIFRFTPEHLLNIRGMSWSHFAWEEADLQSSESYSGPSCTACEAVRAPEKNPLHTVWQGPQKADGALCNKHLIFLLAGNASRKPLALFPITFCCWSLPVYWWWNQHESCSHSGEKSHLCVKGEPSFWVRHVATIPAFLIVKCQSETEEVLTIWPEWHRGYARISRVSTLIAISRFESVRGCKPMLQGRPDSDGKISLEAFLWNTPGPGLCIKRPGQMVKQWLNWSKCMAANDK